MAFDCDFKTNLRLKILFERTSARRLSANQALGHQGESANTRVCYEHKLKWQISNRNSK